MDMDPGLAQHLDRGHDHLNPTHPTTPDRKNPVDKPAQTGSTNTPTTKTDTKPTIRSIRHSQTPHIGGSRLSDTATIKGGGPNREGDVVGQSERQLCPTTSPSTSGHDAIDAFVEEFTSMRRGFAFSAKGSVTHKTPSE